ncbi:MAG: hypothetical protein ACJ76I_14330 [Gaiellaceae bacterium]
MRFSLPLSLAGLAAILAFVLTGSAFAREGMRPDQPTVSSMRSLVDHYRTLTWSYERAAHVKRTQTSFSYRRSSDRAYLQWSIDTWTKRAYLARISAIGAIHRQLAVALPEPPTLHAQLYDRLAYSRRLTLRLRQIYPGTVTRSFAAAEARTARETLRLWQARSAQAAVAVAEHADAAHGGQPPAIVPWLHDAFMCIHRYEGAWNANTGNGYYGGLQMDLAFQSLYGGDFLGRWGTADKWPAWAQLQTAARAYQSGRGFAPWPNTGRACGLL